MNKDLLYVTSLDKKGTTIERKEAREQHKSHSLTSGFPTSLRLIL